MATALREYDWISILLYLGLVIVGWLMIYTVGYDASNPTSMFDIGTAAGRQGLWILVSIVVGLSIMLTDAKFFKTFAYPIYGVSIALLIAVLLIGTLTKGATSWFQIGSFKFQPSEIAKFATCLALCTFLSGYKVSIQNFKTQAIAFAIFLFPMFLVLLQGDAGSALVFTSFTLLLFREGLNALIYMLGILVASLFIFSLLYPIEYIILTILMLANVVVVWNFEKRPYWMLGMVALLGLSLYGFSIGQEIYALIGVGIILLSLSIYAFLKLKKGKNSLGITIGTVALISVLFAFSVNYLFNNILQPHQQERINIWLQPEKTDPLGPRYNVTQSKLAIASGGLEGKGWLEGTLTKLDYIPEQTTDFIFCTIGEEHGFIGTFSIILAFLILLIRLTVVAERQQAKFTRLYAYGVAGIIAFHVLINIGMTVGLMPVIGIPLPFISYGGSSLLSFTILLAVLIKLDSNRAIFFR